MSVCAACGLQRQREHRFCPGCGARFDDAAAPPPRRGEPGRARAAAAQRAPERKHVTVLFADLCGSTERVASVDPEEAQAYLERALRVMTDAVQAYGGTISQLLGDGLLALFGAPLAQEDHALRACLSAIAIQQRARDPAYAAPGMVVRIGVHSGEVVLGSASEYLASHYRADGSAIHLAARLEQMARPGTVLVSEATYRLVADQLQATPLGAHAIRGLGGEVGLFELATGGNASPAGLLTRRRYLGPLVGRGASLDELNRVAGQVLAHGMRIVGLRGDAGIGKSRLLAEFAAGLQERGFRACSIAARAYATHVPYAVIADLVRALMVLPRGHDVDEQREAAHATLSAWPEAGRRHHAAIRDVLDLGPPDAAWQALTPSQRRRHITDAVHWLIAELLAASPLVIVIDDMFLADRDSQRLLEQLARRLESLPVLLCASYRQDFVHRWSNSPGFMEHWLGPLPAADLTALARALLGPDASLDALVDALVERADGNAFFLEQLALTLVDDGTLVGTPGAYTCTRPVADLRTPGSVAAVVGARVDRLAPATKAALEAAAILGDPINAGLIAHMQQCTPAEAAQHLAQAAASGLLAKVPHTEQPSFVFAHGLMQEVVAGALTGPRRKSLHRAAHAALREHYGDQLADVAPVLAHHAYSGESWADAAHFALRAMARAIARSANRDALRMFDLGLDAARRIADTPPALQAELGLRLKALGALVTLGHTDAMIANLERADALAHQLGDRRRQAGVQLQLAVTLWTRGSYRQGLTVAHSAAQTAISAGSRITQMAAVQARMLLNHGLGRYAEAADDARSVERDFAQELGARQVMPGWAVIASVSVKFCLADVQCRMGQLAAAQESCDAAYRELAAQEHAFSRALVDFVQGEIWIAQRRHAEAAARLEGALRLCEAHDMPAMYAPVFAALQGARARAGHAADAAARLEAAIAAKMPQAGGRYNEFYFPHALAIALSAAGRHEAGIAAAAAARQAAATSEQRGHEVDALFQQAETELAAGWTEAATAHFNEVLTLAERCSMALVRQRAAARLAQAAPGLRRHAPPGTLQVPLGRDDDA